MAIFVVILTAFGYTTGIKFEEGRKDIDPKNDIKTQRHVVLLGASLGIAWNISSLSERINNSDYVFEYVRSLGFDKSNTLNNILLRRENKPHAILIKECAAYFPGDLDQYKNLMKQWIEECQEQDVVPVPVTVVPVTRLHSFKKILIDIVKVRNPLKEGNPFKNNRNKAILEYNDWIRIYSRKFGLAVLDLEAAVRYSGANRFLREDFGRVDGLHLNRKAYKAIDQIVIPTLEKVNWKNKKSD